MFRLLLLLWLIVFVGCKKADQERPSNTKSLVSSAEEKGYVERLFADSTSSSFMLSEAERLYGEQRFELFKQVCEIAAGRATVNNDSLNIARARRYLAEYYTAKGVNDSAFQNLKIAEKIYRSVGDRTNLGKVLYKKAVTQYDGYDVLGAELSITEAYSYIQEDDEMEYATLSMTGIISNALEEYDKAISYHLRALDVVKNGNLDTTLFQEESTLNNLGGVFQRINKDEEAIKKFEEALSHKSTLKANPDLYSLLLDNLGYSRLKLGLLEGTDHLFHNAIRIRDSLNNRSGLVVSKLHLSEYFARTGDTLSAITTGREALEIAEQTKAPVDLLITLKHLAAVDKDRASAYSEQYITINDELQKVERRSRDKFAKLELETDQIEIEKNKLAEQNRTLLYFFIGTMMVGFLLFVIRAQRAKNRELLLKQAQQKANEEIYNLIINQQNSIEESRTKEKKRIAQELHDGVLGRLFGARLNLDSMNRLNDDTSIIKRNHYLAELKKIEEDIREISHDLNREKYALINNFAAILQNLIEEQEESFNPKVKCYLDENIRWDNIHNNA